MKEVLIPKKAIFSFLTIGVLPLLLISSVSAGDIVNEVSLSIPSACSISGTGTDSHSANVNNGTYEEDIGKTTLKVFCNDNNGFAVYAVGYTGSEVGATNSTKLVGTSSGLTIDTGTYTQGTTVDSVWAMKISKVTNTSGQPDITYNPNNLTIENGFGSYHAVPANYTKVASFSSITDTTLGSKLETTYAAFISGTQRADTYNGKVKYTLVHPNNAAGNTLYIMQEVANWKNSLSTGQEVNAMDSRDGKFYKVAKLADGNVWMTQNLDLDIDSTRTYTNEDTDLGYNTSTGEYESATWTPIIDNSIAWNAYVIAPAFYDPGDLYWSGLAYVFGQDYDEDAYYSTTGIPQYHLGNYYTYSAALAMNQIDSPITPENGIHQSICPAGWTLPRGSSSGDGDFGALISEYGFTDSPYGSSNDIWDSPLYIAPFGYRHTNESPDQAFFARIGDYWLVKDNIGYNGLAFKIDTDVHGGINYHYPLGVNMGASIRCIAR